MFTGLVEEVAILRGITTRQHSAHLQIAAKRILEGVQLGDSIAVNGVCLTVAQVRNGEFTADAVPETMRRTNLGRLGPGQAVNVERALRLGDRLGGHIVSGHVDGVGIIRDIQTEGIATVLTVQAANEVMRYVVHKGSICIDGTSLTVMDTMSDAFRVSIIPHTAANTTLTNVRIGSVVNLECDILAKYVEKMLAGRGMEVNLPFGVEIGGETEGPKAGGPGTDRQSSISYALLQEHGFV